MNILQLIQNRIIIKLVPTPKSPRSKKKDKKDTRVYVIRDRVKRKYFDTNTGEFVKDIKFASVFEDKKFAMTTANSWYRYFRTREERLKKRKHEDAEHYIKLSNRLLKYCDIIALDESDILDIGSMLIYNALLYEDY